MKIRFNYLLLLLLLILISSFSFPQENTNLDNFTEYSFLNLQHNSIQNPNGIKSFFEKLKSNQNNSKQPLSIFIISDSHFEKRIQANAFSKNFEAEGFGDINYGFVYPQITKKITQHIKVPIKKGKKKRYVRKTVTKYETVNYDEKILDPDTEIIVQGGYNKNYYEFNRIKIILDKNDKTYDLEIYDNNNSRILSVESNKQADLENSLIIDLPKSYSGIKIKFVKNSSNQNYGQIYGISLENQSNSFTIHNYSIRGIAYDSYYRNEKDVLSKVKILLKELKPDLVYIALGTNDGHTKKFNFSRFSDASNFLIDQIKIQNQTSEILISSPPDSYIKVSRRRKRDNKNIYIINKTLRQISQDKNLAFWDFYHVLGGSNSISKLHKYSLAGSDLIHLTAKGYNLQGLLLYKAIKQSYDGFISN